MDFIHDDFLLHSTIARNLYHNYAAQQPILDYHSHLPPADIAADRRFQNLCEPWLEGDHYKWRAMRANGIPESHITGAAEPYEKFLAWARTVPAKVNVINSPEANCSRLNVIISVTPAVHLLS